MKKCTRLLALLLTFVMVFALAASSAEAAPKTYSLKIAHVNSQTHPAHIALEKFKEIVEEKTDGAVKVDIYDSSVLGGELEEIQQVIDGSLTAAMIMGMSNWQNMVPETAIEELPFMYPDVELSTAPTAISSRRTGLSPPDSRSSASGSPASVTSPTMSVPSSPPTI